MDISHKIQQLTIISQGIIDELTKERDEIEALHSAVQRREEEVNRRNTQLIKERSNVLLQVESIRKEREELSLREKTVDEKMKKLEL